MAFGLIAQGHGRLLQRPTAHWLLEGSPEDSSSWEGISGLLQPIWASGVSHREVSNRKALVHKLLPLWGMWDSCRGRKKHLVDFKGGYQWPILGNKQHLHRERTGNSLLCLVNPSDSGLFLLSISVPLCSQTKSLPAYLEQQRWQDPVDTGVGKDESAWQFSGFFSSYASVFVWILSRLFRHSQGLGTCTDAWLCGTEHTQGPVSRHIESPVCD